MGITIGSEWTDAGVTTINYSKTGDGNPQAIRIAAAEGDVFGFTIRQGNYDCPANITITDGKLIIDDQLDRWGGDGTTLLRLTYADWMQATGGKSVEIFLDGGYIYVYTEDGSVIWIYKVRQNTSGYDIEEGTVTKDPNAFGVFQYDGSDWQPYGGGSGSQGPQGPQGADGAQGPQGADGAQGPQGPAGSGSGGSSYITDLQPNGINILEGNGVGYVSGDDGQGNPTQYTTIEPSNDGSAYVNTYTDDGQGNWVQSDSYQLLNIESIKNDQDDVMASGIIDSNDKVLKVEPDSDGTTQVGGYEPGMYDEPTFTRERYLVSSTNISKMVKITESDYDTLVLGDNVDENTFYVVVPDPQIGE